jgi:Ca2+-binding EF-hand superfamily protein
MSHQPGTHGNALSQLQPAQVRVLRDGFQILDRDGDGTVNREDVVDMLTQLGAYLTTYLSPPNLVLHQGQTQSY